MGPPQPVREGCRPPLRIPTDRVRRDVDPHSHVAITTTAATHEVIENDSRGRSFRRVGASNIESGRANAPIAPNAPATATPQRVNWPDSLTA